MKKRKRKLGNQNQQVKPRRDYKDQLIRMIYKDKTELLNLYNALNGSEYDNPDDLEIVTLENAIYMNMKNDISFVIHTELWLYEHQSTYNPNMPLRDLFYVAEQYRGMTEKKNLYGSKRIQLPTPQFIILYNGVEPQPERMEIRLSDMFIQKENPSLELICTMLNINPGYNEQVKEKCKSLHDYVVYVELVRKYSEQMKVEDAVAKAIDECIQNGVLADFLAKNRAEAINMSIFEYDEEKHMQQEREYWLAEGKAKGEAKVKEMMNQLILKLVNDNRLEDLSRCASDPELQEKLMKEYEIQ